MSLQVVQRILYSILISFYCSAHLIKREGESRRKNCFVEGHVRILFLGSETEGSRIAPHVVTLASSFNSFVSSMMSTDRTREAE